ncbi:MAG: FAD-dependent oxidoreductase, partial [Planctomycetota bacterium]
GTCATIGQAAGTGAALCATTDRDPADIDVKLLQRQLVEDDQYIPTRLHDGGAVMEGAMVTGEPELLGNPERDLEDERHGVDLPVGEPVTLTLAQPMSISAIRLVLDSNFADGKPMPASYPLPHTERVVGTLLRDFTVEARVDGAWQVVADVTDNHQRLVRPSFDPVTTDALRLTPRSTWSGSDKVRVFSFAALERLDVALPDVKVERFQDLVAAVPAADLAEPDPVDDADHDEAHGDPANMTTAAVRKKRGTLAGITSGA